MGIPQEVENEFKRHARNCLHYQMCAKIGTIQPEDYAISTNPNDFGPISVYSRSRETEQFPQRIPPLNSTFVGTKKDIELQVGYSKQIKIKLVI